MIKMPPIQYDVVPCKGGLDQLTPSLSLNKSYLMDVLNFEVSVNGGYARIGGYEAFDGQPSPSDATYLIIQVASFTNTPTVGQTLTGASSGTTGVIAVVASNYMAVTKASGSYTNGEIVNVGATEIGTVEEATTANTAQEIAEYYNASADIYRADIAAVPGAGSVLGVTLFGGIVYAFRKNAVANVVDMYKSSAAGWVQVAFEYEVEFSNANTSVGDGDTLTQGGVTATIRRVVVQTGTLLSGTNTGRLVISVTAGGNFAAGAATTTGAGALTLSGAQTAITLTPGGKFEFDTYNFFGVASGLRLYGCDGINRMFEFDGTYFVPIETGSTPDTPKHLRGFQDHLHCQIGSSNLHSGISDPYNWTSTAGASEKALGDTLTGYAVQPGSSVAGAMAIFGSSNVYMLYGTSAADWQYTTFIKGVGAKDYSAQVLSDTLMLDDRGVMNLRASQNYGNFDQSSITNNIKTYINQKRNIVSGSCISRERSQYRVFFSDGYALYSTIENGKYKGSTKVLFDNPVYCAADGELTGGAEAIFVGSTDGYVYQLDKGSSFNGAAISAYATFAWNHSGSPRTLKRYRRLSVEITGDSYVGLSASYSLAYGSANEVQPSSANYDANLSESPTWDEAGVTWDTPGMTWDGTSLLPTEMEMAGTGENVQITLTSGTDYIYPYTINSYILHYTLRRALR